MKYIIVEKAGMELAILFPEQIQHNEALNTFAQPINPVRPISAGFCAIEPTAQDGLFNVTAKGESVSLKLKSRGASDAEVIQTSLLLSSLHFA